MFMLKSTHEREMARMHSMLDSERTYTQMVRGWWLQAATDRAPIAERAWCQALSERITALEMRDAIAEKMRQTEREVAAMRDRIAAAQKPTKKARA